MFHAFWVTAGHSQEPSYIILDINTGLPVNGAATANGARSAAVVQQGKQPRDTTTDAAQAQTGQPEAARHEHQEEFRSCIFPKPRACWNLWQPGREELCAGVPKSVHNAGSLR